MPKSKVHIFLKKMGSGFKFAIFSEIAENHTRTRKDLLSIFDHPRIERRNHETSIQRAIDFLRNFGVIESVRSTKDVGKPATYQITPKGMKIFEHLEEIRQIVDEKPSFGEIENNHVGPPHVNDSI